MRLGVVGKGGVGKTTVAALLARTWSDRGSAVVAIDVDSNPNLGLSLGLSWPELERSAALPATLVVGGETGCPVRSLLQEYGTVTPAGVTLLSAIRLDHAGGGGTCGSHAAVRALLGGGIDEEADVTVVDMGAGLEHLSRAGGTLAHADVVVVVMEPGSKSVDAAGRAVDLLRNLRIPAVYGLGNKSRGRADDDFFATAADATGVPLAAVLPYDEGLDELRPGGGVGVATLVTAGQVVDRLVWATRKRKRPAPRRR